VLVVEPEAKELAKIRVSLEGIGCRLTFEEVEGQVPARIVNERPSIVILGIGVAGPPGARLMRRIKSDRTTAYVTLIAISHPKDKDAYADALTLGVRDVLKGPVQMGDLQYRVGRAYRTILEKRKLAARRAEALERRRAGHQGSAPATNGPEPALRRAALQAGQPRAAGAGADDAPRQRPPRPAAERTEGVRQRPPGANPVRRRRST
jgi:DNA-binding response OmpR family regulator